MTPSPRLLAQMACAVLSAFLAARSFAAVTPNTNLTADQLASRFLAQATFGPSPDSIAELRALGYDYSAWIDAQAALPATEAVPLLLAAKAANPATLTSFDKGLNRRARTQVMLSAPDQLRQRVAYALSQIMVISDADTVISDSQEGSSSYYDMLSRNALGNFRTLMMDVTRHPMMGRYLSHYKNRKANTTTGTRPDENYAREVMQLFTIGLYNLNQNGTTQNDSNGRPIESYTNDDITEFAEVFTGLTDFSTNNTGTGTGRLDFPSATANYTTPMRMWPQQHDTSSKVLLLGRTLPALSGTPTEAQALQDIQDAINNLVEHPNTAPFVSRLLIQRLVTSNPSPAYISRVATVFANNGSNVRGDLLAVVKAILLDTEARSTTSIGLAGHGKLREPFLRLTHFVRAFKYSVVTTSLPYLYYDVGGNFTESTLGQFPLGSPSVFNFYSPDYEPPGPIASAGLVGPEFQILNSVFSVTTPNAFYSVLQSSTLQAGQIKISLDDQIALAANPSQLLDNVDLLLTHGTLSATSRASILSAVQGITLAMSGNSATTLNLNRVRMAIYLVMLSPDYAIIQ